MSENAPKPVPEFVGGSHRKRTVGRFALLPERDEEISVEHVRRLLDGDGTASRDQT